MRWLLGPLVPLTKPLNNLDLLDAELYYCKDYTEGLTIDAKTGSLPALNAPAANVFCLYSS